MINRILSRFHGGVHLPDRKSLTAGQPVRKAHLPDRLYLPLHQHIGASAEPVVAVGDSVLKGQMIAHACGYVSAPVHASSSGKVIAIEDHAIPHPSGASASCIVIETDGEDRWIERSGAEDYLNMDHSHLRNLIRNAGIVGLGGAGFPSFIKLNPGPDYQIDTLILNGAECEPFITCDDLLMRMHPEEIISGIKILRYALKAKHVVIAVEDNKPEAYQSLKGQLHNEDIEVVQVPTLYPVGGEKQLIQVITGKEVPHDGLPLNIGIVIQNVSTAAAVHRAVNEGTPLVSRYVTVTGGGVTQPRNLEVLFGTPVNELLEQCGGTNMAMSRLVMGGPMMGFELHQHNVPVIKTTNCILAATDHDLSPEQPMMPCIRCGSCADACPVSLLPQQLYWFARSKEFDKAQNINLFDCIECGCCSYVCPSHIPLVHYFRFSKAEIAAKEREQEKADQARARHEARQARLDREKAERAARLASKKAALAAKKARSDGASGGVSDDKKAAIKAAIERAKAKKAAKKQAGTEPEAEKNRAVSERKRAEMKAAIEQAKVKKMARKQAESGHERGVSEQKKAEMRAAIARAKAKKAEKKNDGI
ncbi:MAG TPA: electron transport complex subunit RsxC [Gammaproteobacteria bacterium]|nr:electron transport complex subunit RsxC [Gammaproteobacteria bacterium]